MATFTIDDCEKALDGSILKLHRYDQRVFDRMKADARREGRDIGGAFGMDSLTLIELMHEVEDWLGLPQDSVLDRLGSRAEDERTYDQVVAAIQAAFREDRGIPQPRRSHVPERSAEKRSR